MIDWNNKNPWNDPTNNKWQNYRGQGFGLNNFFPVKGDIYFYDKQKKIRAVDKKGGVLDEDKSKEALKNRRAAKASKAIPSIQETEIEKYANEHELIYIGGKLFNENIKVAKKYFDFIKNAGLVKNTRGTGTGIDLKAYNIYNCFGYDNQKNSYWTGISEKCTNDICCISCRVSS
jgi:hypothetical protein